MELKDWSSQTAGIDKVGKTFAELSLQTPLEPGVPLAGLTPAGLAITKLEVCGFRDWAGLMLERLSSKPGDQRTVVLDGSCRNRANITKEP
ncbi:hypothetical protein NDU88_001049 [Pleurodeles waltl]|uniref:Uncharacterized protein n=1 Tax=Pleurodeles waltl TaxID=8319 RepID=A0AAV7LZX1_PLEWA|nr:hypothetical protein NDU88_001049 [Pleurodeles waltl]